MCKHATLLPWPTHNARQMLARHPAFNGGAQKQKSTMAELIAMSRRDCFMFFAGCCMGNVLTILLVLGQSFISSDKIHVYPTPSYDHLFETANLNSVECNISPTNIIRVARDISIARKHVRGTKTAKALFRATKNIVNILQKLQINHAHVTQRKVVESVSICPEIYKGMKYGFPWYRKGFVVTNCTYAKPLSSLITLAFVFKEKDINQLEELVKSVYNFSTSIHFKINVPLNLEKGKDICKNLQTCSITTLKGTEGSIWNKLVSEVSTPYVLIGRNVTIFNIDTRIDRLIRQIERLQVHVAGGSYRNDTGHWFIGCQQNVLKNFTLVYEAGYDESKEECQFCDHVDGPFIIKTEILHITPLSTKIKDQGLFEDFFLRIQNLEKVVCPDSLFFTQNLERSLEPRMWSDFFDAWKVHKISFSGAAINFPCSYNYTCATVKNGAHTPCCLLELANLLAVYYEGCERASIPCEIESGSVMGAVKMHSILPWEKDGDTDFLSTNFTALLELKQFFESKGLNFTSKDTRRYEKDGLWGGFFLLRSKYWYIEIWGNVRFDSITDFILKHQPTKVNVNGHWLNMTRNPALYARNRYGLEIFKHVQHWGDIGQSNSWTLPQNHEFLPCMEPGHQSCLDSYNPDGSLQFRDPIP